MVNLIVDNLTKTGELYSDIKVENIRNISIISHVDHGKTTLTDYLLASGGLLPSNLAGSLRALDSLPEEQRRGITIEASLASYILNFETDTYLINLIDTPGHVDFSGKVAESLRLVDGSIIIVDAVEGVMAQTKSVLKQAIKEQIKFVLYINKIDRLILELQLNTIQIQSRVQRIIGAIQNICISLDMKYQDIPNFTNGTMILGSALDGWGVDHEFVSKGGTLDKFLENYERGMKIENEIRIANVINKAIISQLPNPRIGHMRKFPELINNSVDELVLDRIMKCEYKDPAILLLGRQEPIEQSGRHTFMSRVISGSVKKGDFFFSSLNGARVKVINTSLYKGRTKKNVRTIEAGKIGSINYSIPLTSGDILAGIESEKIILKGITYIQDPVVSISIEPLDINQIGKLQKSIEEICQYTPGLFFEFNKATGELVVQGVGSLQLDVLVRDLRALQYSIEVSNPIILSYEIPTKTTDVSDLVNSTEFVAGRVIDLVNEPKHFLKIKDYQGNILYLENSISREAEDGVREVFKQLMKISPRSALKIKDLYIIIKNDGDDPNFQSYENTLIFGSKLIKKALVITTATPHEPYYDVEIVIPDSYLGNILQELQRIHGFIISVETNESDSTIFSRISVREALKIADRFRQLSDGNAFWSYQQVSFLPIE